MGPEASRDLAVAVIDDTAGLEALRADWEALQATGPSVSGGQTFAYAEAAWAWRLPSDTQLRIITVREAGRLVGLWPLHLRRIGAVTLVRHLGTDEGEEYAEPLIAAAAAAPDKVARALFDAATASGDVLEVRNLSLASPMLAVVEAAGKVTRRGDPDSPIASFGAFESWEAFAATRSKSFRQGLRYDRKRLMARARLTFREVTPETAGPFVDWIMASKVDWLNQRRIGKSWLRLPQTAALYKALVGREGTGVLAFALDSGDQTIAGCLCLLSGDRLEYYITAFDPALSAFSPGNLLIEDLGRWCIPRGVHLDFRLTAGDYKLRWSDRREPFRTRVMALGPRGLPYVWGLRFRDFRLTAVGHARRAAKALLPDDMVKRMKGLLRRRRA
ncbi:GNAT family N-acetyltransferase [Phenylobacterium sp.]|jgi:CelD/BcsL family acetyltransferase involved in cellulose biosynthesis|uniref:GNAT family N-acetyltransferase n=1 Tax=Phenylobacterium sp. TaxID=1871053 RepID=UPI002F3E9460